MTNLSNQLPMFFQRRNLHAWVVLTICLSLLLFAQMSLHRQVMEQAALEFDGQSQAIIEAIENRLKQHEQILLGGAGLFDASSNMQRDDWHIYVERLNLSRNYPGILGVGFSRVIKPEDLQAHVAQVRAEGFPDYNVRPAGERSLYTSIIYLEPFSGRNLAAFGYDMMSQATRAKAMRLAVDEHRTSMTGKVTLVQENKGKVQAGFLMYVPVYRKGMAIDTAEQRWAALVAYVYSPYRMNDLMNGIMGQHVHMLDFSIYDGSQVNEDSEMYLSVDDAPAKPSSFMPQFTEQRRINSYGHSWTVNLESRPEFEENYELSLNMPMLVLGSSTSLMLFFLVSILSFRRIRAEEQAQILESQVRERTRDLHEALVLKIAVLDNAAHAIIAATPEGIITVFNKKAEQLLGYTAEEMIGKQTPAIIHVPAEVAERAEQISAELNMQLEPGFEVFVAKSRLRLPNTYEWTYVRKDGSRFPVSLSVTALRDEDDEIYGFLGLAVDITAQKVAELALRENAEHTQAILDNVVDGIITINQMGIIQSYNLAAETIFGYSAREAIGCNVNMLMPEPYHSMHDGYLESYHSTGVAKIIGIGREVEGRRKDGSTFPLDLAVSRSQQQGSPLYIGLVRDITERKRIDKMKTEFVSTVSHELRTPLTAIRGSLGLIAGGSFGEMPAQVKQMIDLAHKNSLILNNLINDLLDMDKLLAGKMQFDLKAQPLMPLIEQALQSNNAYAQQYQVKFVITDGDDDVFVQVDDMRVQQVLSNFLSNAAKFSPPGGQVDIVVRQRNEYVRVEVIDHGPGIPAGFHDRIFQKFSQADSSDSRQKGGTGLGLVISKELIERMSGIIGFESEEGKGSTFYFELPRVNKDTGVSSKHERHSTTPHVLVIEDESELAQLYAIILTNAGYGVDIAPNAETALDFLNRDNYDVVTLDIMLPDHSGIKLIEKIRSKPQTGTIPIIVISAYSQKAMLASKDDIKGVDWLEKPVSAVQLVSVVQRVLSEKNYGSDTNRINS